MSTIHDALKKVQDNMGQQGSSSEKSPEEPKKPHNPFNPTPQPPTPEEPVTQDEEPKDNKKRVFVVFIILLVIAALGAAGTILAKHSNLISKIKHQPIFSKKLTPPPQVAPPIPKGTIHVQGIMALNSGQVALINNVIYKVGDTVSYKKIESITKNDVTLIDQTGKKETLKVAQ